MPLKVFQRLQVSWALAVTHTLIAQSEPRYEIAFASFGPGNAEIFLAGADGENPQPFLPHAGFDGNASFSADLVALLMPDAVVANTLTDPIGGGEFARSSP